MYDMNDGTWIVYYSTKKSLGSVKRVFANAEKKSIRKKINKSFDGNHTAKAGSSSNTTNSDSKKHPSKKVGVSAKSKEKSKISTVQESSNAVKTK